MRLVFHVAHAAVVFVVVVTAKESRREAEDEKSRPHQAHSLCEAVRQVSKEVNGLEGAFFQLPPLFLCSLSS